MAQHQHAMIVALFHVCHFRFGRRMSKNGEQGRVEQTEALGTREASDSEDDDGVSYG